MYRVLFLFKRVQVQLSEEYPSTKDVMRVIKKLIIVEHAVRLFTAVYCTVQTYLWVQIYMLDSMQNGFTVQMYARVQMLHLVFTVANFSLNIGFLSYFCKMGQFFIATMSEGGEIKPWRVKVLTTLLVGSIIIIQIRNLIVEF